MLWFLHLCADAGIVVIEYEDAASGVMSEHVVPEPDAGAGEFTLVVLRPRAVITDSACIADAMALHLRAHELCFIARSVNFPVQQEPVVVAPYTLWGSLNPPGPPKPPGCLTPGAAA